MRQKMVIAVLMVLLACLTPHVLWAQECLPPALEYSMGNPVYSSCTAITLGDVITTRQMEFFGKFMQ